jgi:hypothetical protein
MHIRSSKLHYQEDLDLNLVFKAFPRYLLAFQNKTLFLYQEYRYSVLVLALKIQVLILKRSICFSYFQIFCQRFSSFRPYRNFQFVTFQSKLFQVLIWQDQPYLVVLHFCLPLYKKAIDLSFSQQHYKVHQSNLSQNIF